VIGRATGAWRFDAFGQREQPDEFHLIVSIGRRVGVTTPIVSRVAATDPPLNLADDRKARQLPKQRFRNFGRLGYFNEFSQDRLTIVGCASLPQQAKCCAGRA
jgi:hypothetical protein